MGVKSNVATAARKWSVVEVVRKNSGDADGPGTFTTTYKSAKEYIMCICRFIGNDYPAWANSHLRFASSGDPIHIVKIDCGNGVEDAVAVRQVHASASIGTFVSTTDLAVVAAGNGDAKMKLNSDKQFAFEWNGNGKGDGYYMILLSRSA